MSLFSVVEQALSVLGISPDELQIASVDALIDQRYPALSTDRPALIGLPEGAADSRQALAGLLRRAYPDEHRVTWIGGLGSGAPQRSQVELGALAGVGHGEGWSFLYLPPLPCSSSVETFLGTVARLRAPDGCPWDQKQTHRSLRQGFQEEAYEVLDALDQEDMELLKEELGDVLLHILLQAQIASEMGEFRWSDVVCGVNRKIVYRHPHVFSGLEVRGVEEVLVNWEELKQLEKGERKAKPSSLDGISPSMPALARAQSIQRHVDRTGIVGQGVGELATQIEARLSSLLREDGLEIQEETLGELLFALANLARQLDLDAEGALREASARFERHYREIEDTLEAGS